MSERVHCNICLREARMVKHEDGYWHCSCCGRRLWKIGGLFPLDRGVGFTA